MSSQVVTAIEENVMQSVILAGGKGTRLRPLTLDLPKPVVPVVNRPFLLYQLDILERAGFDRAILSLSYKPGRIRDTVQGRTGRINLDYVVEDEPLGTGGAVRYAARPEEGTVAVFNGDILSDLDLNDVLRFHREKQAGVTIVLTEVEDPTAYGLVLVHPDGRVRQFLEKPSWDEVEGRTINAGTYIVEPEYLERIRPGAHVSIEREFFPALVEAGAPFYAYIHRGYWIDIGTVGKYVRVHHDFFQRGEGPGNGYRREGQAWLADGATTGAHLALHGPLVAGPGATIGRGVTIGRFAVLGPGCVIGDDVHLDGCVLWEGTRVGAGSRLKGCVAGAGCAIGEHVRLSGLLALGDRAVVPDHSHLVETDDDFEAL